jgi:prepilin-type N-terminal cleavage/methylation domain-containing protein
MRRGFTLLELVVALVVLGIALTGLFPLMVVHSRALESLELRYTDTGNQHDNWYCPVLPPDKTAFGVIAREDYGNWYLIPSADPWARKLGTMATLSRQTPTAPSVASIDDDEDLANNDYAETGSGWTEEANPQAFQGDRRRHAPATGTMPPPEIDYAVWTFTIANPGYYQVLATWSQATDQTQATNACYEVYGGGSLMNSVVVSQDVLPDGPVYLGHPWRLVATQYLQAGTLQVKLRGGVTIGNEATDGHVVADGVRIVPVENRLQILSLEKSFDSERATARVRVVSP